jgi:hypothetical protein
MINVIWVPVLGKGGVWKLARKSAAICPQTLTRTAVGTMFVLGQFGADERLLELLPGTD